MLVIAVSQFGNDFRVRLHHHPYEPGDPCREECYEYASERTFVERDYRPADKRNAIGLALVAAWLTPALSHRELLSLCGEQDTLFDRNW